MSEAAISARLATLDTRDVELRRELATKTARLTGCLPGLSQQEDWPAGVAAFGGRLETLRSELAAISEVTSSLSVQVRTLDRILTNVARTRRMVQALGSAKDAVGELEEALQSGDLATAARSVGMFRQMETDGCFDLLEETTKTKTRTLEQETIKQVKSRFEQAIAKGDSLQVSSCARLFAPLGLENEAGNRYVSFARHKFAESCAPLVRMAKAVDEGGAVLENLTKIFLQVADVVQDQEHMQEEFAPLLIRGIEQEADRQGAAVIDVLIKRLTGTHPSGSLRYVDGLLEETAVVFQRVAQFHAYMRPMAASAPASAAAAIPAQMQQVTSLYISSERKFLLQSLEEACVDDVADWEMCTTTLVEDAFFVANKSVCRAIKTSDANIACAVANHAVDCLTTELKAALEAAASAAKAAFANFCSNPKLVLAGINNPNKETLLQSASDKPISSSDSFVHAVANIALSANYCQNLKGGLVDVFNEHFDDANFRQMFSHCVLGLDLLRSELDELHTTNCKLLLHCFKPAFLSPALTNLERLNYDMNETEFTDAQINDPFAKTFLAGATVTVTFLKKFCLPATWNSVIFILIDQLVSRLERLVLSSDKLRFSAFGALQFDNEVRSLANFFAQQTEQSVRGKFAKLTDIACVLNLESVDEFVALYGGRGKLRLTVEEIKTALLLRLDFSRPRIEQIFR